MPTEYSGLTDIEIVILLDMCLVAEKRTDERLAEAIRTYQGTRVAYLQQLQQHYRHMRENFFVALGERGLTNEQIQQQLAHVRDDPSGEPKPSA